MTSQVQHKQFRFATSCGLIVGITTTRLFPSLSPSSINSFTVSKSYKANINESAEYSTTSKKINQHKIHSSCVSWFCLVGVLTHECRKTGVTNNHSSWAKCGLLSHARPPMLEAEVPWWDRLFQLQDMFFCIIRILQVFLSIKCKINTSFPWWTIWYFFFFF